jgi:tetratricopeptide (TPR) repeat protein
VRSIVVTTLSSPQRRRLHRQVAEAIAALRADQPEYAAELAFHFGRAGHGAETEVLRYATSAGDHMRSSYGYREALGHYDAALRAAERLGARAATADVRHVFAGRLAAYEALLDWDGIMHTATRYERWAAQRGESLPPLIATRRLVLLRALMGDLAGAAAMSAEQAGRQPDAAPAIHDMLRRTALILHPVDPEIRDWRLEIGDRPISDLQSPISFTPAPVLPGTPSSDMPAILGPDEAAMTLFQIGWVALMQGLLRDAEPCLLRAHQLAIETSQAAVAVISALQLAHLNALRGDVSASDRWLDGSLDQARRTPEAAWASIWPSIHQAFLLLLDDQHVAAQQRFEQMAAQLRDLPAFQSHRASVEVGLGLVKLADGELAQAVELLNRALSSPQLLYGFVYVAAQHGLARIAALRGDLATARATLSHALEYSARRSLLPEHVRTAIEIARIERDFGDPASTLALLQDAADLARGAGLAPLAAAAAALLDRLLG